MKRILEIIKLKSGLWVAFGSMENQWDSWKQMSAIEKSLYFSSAEINKLSSHYPQYSAMLKSHVDLQMWGSP